MNLAYKCRGQKYQFRIICVINLYKICFYQLELCAAEEARPPQCDESMFESRLGEVTTFIVVPIIGLVSLWEQKKYLVFCWVQV